MKWLGEKMKVQQHNYKTIRISHVTSQESRQEWSWLTYLFPQKWTLAETSSFIHKAKNEWITIVKENTKPERHKNF